ncbi:MAG: nitroreductase family protein [Burkholderiales bacterium]
MTQPEASMSVMDAIRERRSVRAYAPRRLDPATIRTLLAAAVRAPTAVHEEPWAFAVLQDAGALKRISDRAKGPFLEEAHRAHLDRGGHSLDKFTRPDFNIFYDAGTLIVICGKPMGPFVAADCWLAAENLMLAARSMGLGTCVIGSALPALNTAEGKAELGIPAEMSAVAPIIVGVPSGDTPLTPRKEPQVLAWK